MLIGVHVRVLNNYYHVKCDLNDLIRRFPPKEDGTSLAELVCMFESYNIPVVPVKIGQERWLDCPLPYIVIIREWQWERLRSFCHYRANQ